jgi:hypothetical protein
MAISSPWLNGLLKTILVVDNEQSQSQQSMHQNQHLEAWPFADQVIPKLVIQGVC